MSQQTPAEILRDAIADRVCSGAQYEFGTAHAVTDRGAIGFTAFEEHPPPRGRHPVEEGTRFDLASLTKVLATACVAKRAVAQGRLDLDATLASLLPPDVVPRTWDDVTPRTLLGHRSGLVAWVPFYERVSARDCASVAGRDQVRRAVFTEGARQASRGECYSDLGFILMDWVLERALGAPLDELFRRHVAEPLQLKSAGFVPVLRGAEPARDAVCTEDVAWRGGLVDGVVHDGNTWAMGGVSGHAGLFGHATDVGRLARGLIQAARGEREDWLPASIVETFWDRSLLVPGGHFLLGWDTPSGALSSAGRTVDRDRTVGHLGFTGTSLWIDRAREVYVVLLTNRVHPSREEPRIRDVRVRFHDAVWSRA